MTRGLKDFALSWWIGPRFFDAGEIWEYKQRAIKPYKMMANNWAQVTQKKQNRLKFMWVQFISIFMPIFLIFNNYIEFLIQSI